MGGAPDIPKRLIKFEKKKKNWVTRYQCNLECSKDETTWKMIESLRSLILLNERDIISV